MWTGVNVLPASSFAGLVSPEQWQKALSIEGFDQVIRRLSEEIMAIEGGTKKGLLEVAKYIERDMEKTPPLIPVDTGDLRRSYTIHAIQQENIPGVIFGFSVNYALWVHEMVGNINWKRPNSGPKFFEAAINRNHEVILQIIADHAKV